MKEKRNAMKTITHKLWPISYVSNEGKQVDTLYSFNPGDICPEYYVGDAIEVEVQHPAEMSDEHRIAQILKLRAQLAKLEAGK